MIFVTGNKGKAIRAVEQFKEQGLELEWYDHDCIEPNINDIEYISRCKVLEAYEIIGQPCFVVDSGFYIDNYPGESGFPGAFPKRAINDKDGIDALLNKMSMVEERECQFIDCLTYYDGVNLKVFYGVSKGSLAHEKRGTNHERAKSALWNIFIPYSYNRTLAEMTDEERNNRQDGRTSAILEFIKWYKTEYKLTDMVNKVYRKEK